MRDVWSPGNPGKWGTGTVWHEPSAERGPVWSPSTQDDVAMVVADALLVHNEDALYKQNYTFWNVDIISTLKTIVVFNKFMPKV